MNISSGETTTKISDQENDHRCFQKVDSPRN